MVKIDGEKVAGCVYCENYNEFVLPKDVIEGNIKKLLNFILWSWHKY